MASIGQFQFTNNIPAFKRLLEEEKKNILKTIGAFIVGEAKFRTPVDTGILRGSIEYELEGNNEVFIGAKGDDVFYADYVEFGTSRQSAQPYLTPAFMNNITEIKRIIEDGIRRAGERL